MTAVQPPIELRLSLGTATTTKVAREHPGQAGVFFGFCRRRNSGGFQRDGGVAVPCDDPSDCKNSTYPECQQRSGGAFGNTEAREIIETGTPPGSLADGQPHPATLVGVFAVPPAFDNVVDIAGNLPGPAALAMPVSVRLIPGFSSIQAERPEP
jgi:hypothetical protein